MTTLNLFGIVIVTAVVAFVATMFSRNHLAVDSERLNTYHATTVGLAIGLFVLVAVLFGFQWHWIVPSVAIIALGLWDFITDRSYIGPAITGIVPLGVYGFWLASQQAAEGRADKIMAHVLCIIVGVTLALVAHWRHTRKHEGGMKGLNSVLFSIACVAVIIAMIVLIWRFGFH